MTLAGEKKLWLKGAPRSVESASACKHLAVSPIVQPIQTVRMRPHANRVIAPHEDGMAGMILGNVDYWPGLPPLGLVCSCPELLEDARQMMPPEVRASTQHLQTTLDVCRLCPFHEEQKEQ